MKKTNVEIGEDSCGYHDNGANHAPRSKPNKGNKLRKALKLERKRNMLLVAKLQKMKFKNNRLQRAMPFEESIDMEPRHSTAIDISSNDSSTLAISMNSLSAVSINIPECKPLDIKDEIDRKSFENWKDLLEASMELAGITDEHTKNNVFKVKAGPLLLETLGGTPTLAFPDVAIAPYSNAMKRLKDLFGSREYRLVQRQKFRSLTQGADESDLKYVKRVIASAKLCDFDEEKLTENVTEVLQLHALNSKVREAGRKVMRKGGTLTALVDKIRGYELDKTNEEIFKKTHQPEAEAIVAAVTRGRVETDSSARHPSGLRGKSIEYQGRPNWRNFRDNGNNYERVSTRAVNKIVPCWRCTSRLHVSSKCHAVDKVCRNCHKTGHIERACRITPIPNTLKRRVSREDERSAKSGKIATLAKEEDGKDDTNIVSDY
ncbi:uncharacterized protein LOC121598210 isoform X2 [Anopheles merus]|uniref:uncharacterized protein LOC121598210 isoform X2 n=1 Tax=Anopheles merus TaxID=30066 RepID=UPI001BE3D31E|nr:uncharacterized protein LOC121598210 isoform X2 [Anopheles merus]